MSRSLSAPRSFQRDLSSPVEERRFEVGAPDHGSRLDVFLAGTHEATLAVMPIELLLDHELDAPTH